VSQETSPVTRPILEKVLSNPPLGFNHIVWTQNMRRLAVLVGKFLTLLVIVQMKLRFEVLTAVNIKGCWVIGLLIVPSQSSLHSIMCHFCAWMISALKMEAAVSSRMLECHIPEDCSRNVAYFFVTVYKWSVGCSGHYPCLFLE
jgi:hypothetical protein